MTTTYLPGVVAVANQAAADDGLAHRYWRVLVVANSGNSQYVAINRLTMKFWPGGLPQAIDHSQTKDLFSAERSGFEAHQAFQETWPEDYGTGQLGNFNSIHDEAWSPNINDIAGEWLGYDFGTPVRVREFEIQARPEVAFVNHTARDVTLQYSDDAVIWVDVESFTKSNFTTTGQVQVYTVAGSPAQDLVEVGRLEAYAVMGGRAGRAQVQEMDARIVVGQIADAMNVQSMDVRIVIDP